MVTATASLANSDALSTAVRHSNREYDGPTVDYLLTASTMTTSKLLRINSHGQREFELEFWNLAVNRAGTFCIRFDVAEPGQDLWCAILVQFPRGGHAVAGQGGV
ncbi:hypothetical protein SBRCBS47491_004668 [Sporothrix bragantina]|uniref:Uncharacterized protein n=1 Tax=Sporothrix bragantina TaxID=671064 RepID=A0ABP0BQB9_9PEZI